jgi:hypothetical protein
LSIRHSKSNNIEHAKALFAEYKPERLRQQNQRVRDRTMALTRDFIETVAARVARDPTFAKALLDEAATLFLNGDPHAARLVLRDLVNASVGFEALAAETKASSRAGTACFRIGIIRAWTISLRFLVLFKNALA